MSQSGLLRLFLARVGRVSLFVGLLAFAASAQNLTCPANEVPPERNFQGQTIKHGNFSHRDLSNANFSSATLIAPFFAFANLKNANFQGAIITNDSSNPALVADFSFANLEGACFLGVQFNGPTYFTSATLTCADFSKTDLSAGNAIFGESPLTFERAKTNCRLAFRASVMNCEFLADWRFLDLSGADVKACSTQLAGRDFSGSKFDSVNLEGANLDRAKFVKADLSRAILDKASLRGSDLSYATLLGAHLNLANLTGANLYHTFLSNDTPSGITNAASVRQAHLKNANLSFAQLSGVDFTYANFYGHDPGRDQCLQNCSLARQMQGIFFQELRRIHLRLRCRTQRNPDPDEILSRIPVRSRFHRCGRPGRRFHRSGPDRVELRRRKHLVRSEIRRCLNIFPGVSAGFESRWRSAQGPAQSIRCLRGLHSRRQ